LKFEEVTGIAFPLPSIAQAPLQIFAENVDESLTLNSYSSNSPSAASLSVKQLFRDALGLDGEAMAEEDALEGIKKRKEAEALHARPHFLPAYTSCSCCSVSWFGQGHKKYHRELEEIKEHKNCVRSPTCELVQWAAKLKVNDGYEWKWELTKGSYGQHLIDKTPLPEPEKSKVEQAAELEKCQKDADARKFDRAQAVKKIKIKFYEAVFGNIASCGDLFDAKFTVVQKQTADGATNGTLLLEMFLRPALFVSARMYFVLG
jgi:hypothetical protein